MERRLPRSMEFDGLAIVRGKCQFWRESLTEEDRFNSEVKPRDWRVQGSCFVEGRVWDTTLQAVPEDCPMRDRCRYFCRT